MLGIIRGNSMPIIVICLVIIVAAFLFCGFAFAEKRWDVASWFLGLVVACIIWIGAGIATPYQIASTSYSDIYTVKYKLEDGEQGTKQIAIFNGDVVDTTKIGGRLVEDGTRLRKEVREECTAGIDWMNGQTKYYFEKGK